MRGLDHLHGAGQVLVDLGQNLALVAGLHLVGLVEDDEVGAEELVLEHLLERIVVIDGGVGRALRCERIRIVGEGAGGHGRAVDHGDHAVDRHAGADVRPVEGAHEGLRQGEARGLDQDVLGRVRPVEQRVQGRDEIVGHRAADAAVGQFDDVFLRAALDAAALDEGAVEAEIAELVDENGEAAPAGVLEEVAHQGGFAGTEESGDDGAGDLRQVAHEVSLSAALLRPRCWS